MPVISIIIPVYNAEKYLLECLESIKNQTFTDWECICIDDGSRDHSGEILDAYILSDSRFVVEHKKNAGVTSARKRGGDISRGKYIVFVDSDDVLPPDSLSILLDIQKQNNAELVRGNFSSMIQGKLKENKLLMTPPSGVVKGVNLIPFWYRAGSLWMTLYDRSLFRDPSPFPPEKIILGEDALTFFELLLRTKKAVYTNKIVYYYRDNAVSVSHRLYAHSEKELVADIDYTLGLIDFINKYKNQKLFYLKYLAADNIYGKISKSSFFKEHKSFIINTYLRFFIFSLPVQVIVWKINWKKWLKMWLFTRRFFIS